ncbi:hypothetical protein FDP25_05600 [Roseovarius sp. A21]|uniref:Lipoprotein n=1 Tax=Roseovarius bejariae TaxID=2576383 RepID=A0A844CZ46_9RHOB|nr:hypothetical protein [Roseovarius bejariae]MRU14903.1 hypothetical protein [Roseovarius bejariae]
MRQLVFLGLGALMLAACQADGETSPDTAESCGADALQHLIGEPRGAFESQDIDTPARILPPGPP